MKPQKPDNQIVNDDQIQKNNEAITVILASKIRLPIEMNPTNKYSNHNLSKLLESIRKREDSKNRVYT